jgi:site-specific DNA recombinase
MTVPLRAGLYLRVSTARQAEHDVSIPDQKRHGEAFVQPFLPRAIDPN